MAITLAELIVRIGGDISGVSRAFGDTSDMIDGIGKDFEKTAGQFRKVGVAMVAGGAAIGAGLGHSVSVAADFEQSMSNIDAVSDATGEQMAQLGDLALKMGADTSFSATEAASGVEELTKAGVSAEDILAGGLAGALDLAAAGGVSVADSGRNRGNGYEHFSSRGIASRQRSRTLWRPPLIRESATDVSGMRMAFAQSAKVAESFGLNINETAGVMAHSRRTGLRARMPGPRLSKCFRCSFRQAITPSLNVRNLALTSLTWMESLSGSRPAPRWYKTK